MKGCPLRCVWCHNPEGFEDKPVKMYTKKKCIGCQSCVEVCPEKNLVLTSDGIHLKASGYEKWHEFLLHHAIYRSPDDYLGTGPIDEGVKIPGVTVPAEEGE